MKKVDLFMPPKEQYGVIKHFTIKFSEALQRAGVVTRILEAKYDQPKLFLDKLMKDPPDCTLSFNGLMPDNQGRFFCDLIQIPHIACLLYSAPHFVPLVQSPWNIISCIDRFDCDFFLGLNFNNVLFLPQAVERDLEPGISQRMYDITVFTTLIDYLAIKESWSEKYSVLIAHALEEAGEMVLNNPDVSTVQALVHVFDNYSQGPIFFDPHRIDMITALIEVENYVNGKNQVALISSIKNTRIDVFGETPKTSSWKRFFGQNSNVKIHDPIAFDQAIEVMKQSKIVLSTCASIKNGAHETVFTALAAGALALAPENIYFREFFKDGENIAFYELGKWDRVNEKIQLYLKNEKQRQQVVDQGRQEVMQSQTWDVRAAQLQSGIAPILDQMRARK